MVKYPLNQDSAPTKFDLLDLVPLTFFFIWEYFIEMHPVASCDFIIGTNHEVFNPIHVDVQLQGCCLKFHHYCRQNIFKQTFIGVEIKCSSLPAIVVR